MLNLCPVMITQKKITFNELPDLPVGVHHVVVEVTNGPHTLRK